MQRRNLLKVPVIGAFTLRLLFAGHIYAPRTPRQWIVIFGRAASPTKGDFICDCIIANMRRLICYSPLA